MSDQPAYNRVHFSPQADPRAVVTAGLVRFTVLDARLIRMEFSPDGRFEDRPSQVFWCRHHAVPEFQVKRQNESLVLQTENLRLECTNVNAPFSSETLAVTQLPDGPFWHYGDSDDGNLLGTTRTLDRVSGSTRLEPGLLSRTGWAVVDDSLTLVFDATGWLVPRDSAAGARDLYFFGYGRDYRAALRGYHALSGPVPLLPRWVLGNWWSRYWEYSEQDLRTLMTDFQHHDVPLSVCIVDMDWHLVNVGEGINGWTGYTWNTELFPDPPGFIAWLHDQGLRTALNLHPALGVRPHEVMYAEICQRMGIDPEERRTIPFDIADRRFTECYFEVLHHPQEAIGVDFWWMDWQQGTQTSVAGLDPLWWLNHLHYFDLGRTGKRPFIFSRWGGLGNHRYPIGFSGDTIVSWQSLAFQPYFTATAANVAYGWWSHDIGGHMQGIEDRELYTRWVQFGVFSPIFRLHSTKNPFHERRPWGYDAEVLDITRNFMQLRHALIPYLYTMSRLNESDGVSLVRPMYHDYPDRDEAYTCPQQYLFGTDLVVSPYTAPADHDTRLARQAVWLPPGDWYHFFTGEYYRGDAWYACYGALDDMPVFARAGAIIPLSARSGWGGVGNPAEIHLHIFAGDDGRFTLYEDDGESSAYREGAFTLKKFDQKWDDTRLKITIHPSSGETALVPEERTYHVHIHGISEPGDVMVMVDGISRLLNMEYDSNNETARIEPLTINGYTSARITIASETGKALSSRRDRTLETAHRLISAFRMDSLAKVWLESILEPLIAAPDRLADFAVDMAPAQARALLEVMQGAGVHMVTNMAEPTLLVIWNNRETAGFRHHFAQLRADKWHAHERFGSSFGATPRFRAFYPVGERWRLTVDYFGLQTTGYSGQAGSD